MASPNDERFTERFETLKLLGFHPRMTPRLSAAIRKNGGVDRVFDALFEKFELPDEGMALADMIRFCGITPKNVDSDITTERFPVRPELFTAKDSRVFCFDKSMTPKQISAAILAEGYKSDPIEKLLAYGKEHPDEQMVRPIFALGSSWVNSEVLPSDPRVPVLGKHDGGRTLRLYWALSKSTMHHTWGFLASPKKT